MLMNCLDFSKIISLNPLKVLTYYITAGQELRRRQLKNEKLIELFLFGQNFSTTQQILVKFSAMDRVSRGRSIVRIYANYSKGNLRVSKTLVGSRVWSLEHIYNLNLGLSIRYQVQNFNSIFAFIHLRSLISANVRASDVTSEGYIQIERHGTKTI